MRVRRPTCWMARGMMPRASGAAPPVIVNVLPAPVWP
jgi:hypothetical protein